MNAVKRTHPEFARLTLRIQSAKGEAFLDNVTRPQSAGILSERRIARAIREVSPLWMSDRMLGATAEDVAKWIFQAMSAWERQGYPDPGDWLAIKRRGAIGYRIFVDHAEHLIGSEVCS